jgi:hypothetical protein
MSGSDCVKEGRKGILKRGDRVILMKLQVSPATDGLLFNLSAAVLMVLKASPVTNRFLFTAKCTFPDELLSVF